MKKYVIRGIGRRRFLYIAGCLITSFRGMASSVVRQIKVSLSEAHKGTLEIDTRLLDSYGGPEDNLRQFYLDARKLFEASPSADFSDTAIVRAARNNASRLMGGPMLGDLSHDGVTLWMRSAWPHPLTVKVAKVDAGVIGSSGDCHSLRSLPALPAPTTLRSVSPSHASLSSSVKHREGEAPAEPRIRAYSVKNCKPGVDLRIRLDGLSQNTEYQYKIDSKDGVIGKGSFTTAPSIDDKGQFRLTFGSCCHKIGVHNPNLFHQILKRKPHAMMLLGDIAVDDRNNNVNMHRADYLLRDVSQPWREFVAKVPVYASWDDHDYFDNDKSGVPKNFSHEDRNKVRKVWHSNWNNPPADDGREGIYFNKRMGPVEIIMLDTRSCRDNRRRNEYGSYLGAQQMDWLKRILKASTAPFKVLSSGTMWSDYVSKAKDSWGSWDKETREEIFTLIEKEKISGVLLISGDRHGARAFRIPRPSGFTFYEFEAAALGGVPGPSGLVKNCKEQIFGYNGKDFVAFGEFTFDTSGKDPCVTFRLIDENGDIREEHAYKCLKGGLIPQ